MKLTDIAIKNLKPKDEKYKVAAGDGLGIVVYPHGGKAWRFTYIFGGRRRRMSLGEYPLITLKEARTRLAAARLTLAQGEDPGAKDDHQDLTVRELGDLFIEKHAKPRKKSWEQDQRNLAVEVYPALGNRPAAAITRQDVRTLLERIAQRPAPVLHNRTLSLIRKVFNFAIDQELVGQNPAQRIKPLKETAKERHLADSEIHTLLTALPGIEGVSPEVKAALLLTLATGQRPGEVAGLVWEEVKDRWWELPAARAKNGNPNRIWLSAFALELMGEPKAAGPVFPSHIGDQPVSEPALAHALRRMIRDKKLSIEAFSPHDLRRTAATCWAALGVPRLVAMKILNHADKTITAIYDRHSYDGQVKSALNKWSDHLLALRAGDVGQEQEGGEVISFPGRQ
jgi:integrase